MNIPGYVLSKSQELYHQLLNTILVAGLSNNGWTVPNLSYVSIEAVAPSMPLGTLWYDTDSNKLVVKTAAGLEAITSVLI